MTASAHDARQRLIGIAQYCAPGYVAADHLVALLRRIAPGLAGLGNAEILRAFADLVALCFRLEGLAEGGRRHRVAQLRLHRALAVMVPEVTG